jgi:cysteinyl-tRNA synthetase
MAGSRAALASGPSAAPAARAPRLAGIRSWAYQLQRIDMAALSRSPFDVLVIDAFSGARPHQTLRPAELALLRRRPGGGRRIVLAYLSVGEAEDYRYYWRSEWIEVVKPPAPAPVPPPVPPAAGGQPARPPSPAPPPPPAAQLERQPSAKAPSWLEEENDRWSGNFGVKYWEPGWQDILFAAAGSYLERIVGAGFDGVYLDRVDAIYQHQDERASALDDMVDLVERLARRGRELKPGFIVVPQNGEELLVLPRYLAHIDGIAKEDLLYGSPTEGEPNSPAQIANSYRWLAHAEAAGLPVMVVEYLADERRRAEALAVLADRGYVPFFAPRALDRLAPQPARVATPPAPGAAAPAPDGTPPTVRRP